MEEELAVLESIYPDELKIDASAEEKTTRVTITIHSNGDENDLDREARLLRLTFSAVLPANYPEDASPTFTLSQTRGLTDAQLNELASELSSTIEANRGSSVLHGCIELIREKLSEFELPHEACAICMNLITDRADVIRTNCDHFYHRTCLASYVRTKKVELEEKYREMKVNGFRIERDFRQDIEDPVCRQIIASTVIERLPTDVPLEHRQDQEENRHLIEHLSPRMRQWQERTQALFQQQKEKGGIIDLDRSQEIIFS